MSLGWRAAAACGLCSAGSAVQTPPPPPSLPPSPPPSLPARLLLTHLLCGGLVPLTVNKLSDRSTHWRHNASSSRHTHTHTHTHSNCCYISADTDRGDADSLAAEHRSCKRPQALIRGHLVEQRCRADKTRAGSQICQRKKMWKPPSGSLIALLISFPNPFSHAPSLSPSRLLDPCGLKRAERKPNRKDKQATWRALHSSWSSK